MHKDLPYRNFHEARENQSVSVFQRGFNWKLANISLIIAVNCVLTVNSCEMHHRRARILQMKV